MRKQVETLPPRESFKGAGVYAIYYVGDFPAYAPVAEANANDLYEAPIYVGKADPKGGRKGGGGLEATLGSELFNRLNKHGRSVEQASNLYTADFCCRFLVMDDIWIRLTERMLINRYLPLWNVVVDGFGNHDPGGRRSTQHRSPWDVLHPGRSWADKLSDSGDTSKDIEARIREHLNSRL